MIRDLFDRLNRAIDKYEQGSYNEQGFHTTLESIIQSITESHLHELRVFLQDMEADLELTDFIVSETDSRNEYLKIIRQIKARISQEEDDLV